MKVMFPGSFDPPHFGHLALAQQCLGHGWEVVIGIGVNENKPERMFSIEETKEAWWKSEPKLADVVSYTGFTADKAKELGCDAMVRGLRSKEDFTWEWDLMSWNLQNKQMQTIWLPCPSFDEMVLSSTEVRRIFKEAQAEATPDGEDGKFQLDCLQKSVPQPVFEMMTQKLKENLK